MQKGLHVLSKAASIGILSTFFRVHLPGWSFKLCNAFSSSIFVGSDYHRIKDRALSSLFPLSFAPSDSIDTIRNNTAIMNYSSLPPSSELSSLMMEVISSFDDSDTMTMLSGEILDDSCHVLRQFIQAPTVNMEFSDIGDANGNFQSSEVINASNGEEGFDGIDDRREILSIYTSIAAGRFCQIAAASDGDKNYMGQKSRNRKRTWEALQNAAGMLQNDGFGGGSTPMKSATNQTALHMESNTLAVCMVFGALSSLEHYQCQREDKNNGSAKAAASALSSAISRNKLLRQSGRPIASLMLQRYLDHAFRNKNNCFDLSILNHLAKSFQLTEESVKPHVVAALVRNLLQVTDNGAQREDFLKKSISRAFALACQLRPWSILSPVELIDTATGYDFYHAAEEICRSAHKAAKDAEGSLLSNLDGNRTTSSKDYRSQQYSVSKQKENAISAVEKLIDNAIESRMYRRADAIATSFYNLGGRSRYVEARYFHACDTIAKVVSKRQFPIVDRQIERVDKAIAKVEAYNDEDTKQGGSDNHARNNEHATPQTYSNSLLRSPSVEIREYAIKKFEEVGEIAAAQRLASIYNIDYVYDEEAALLAAAMRRDKYIQYEDVFAGEVPPLITEPDQLISGFDRLLRKETNDSVSCTKQGEKHIGFDAEWDEETKGAALLQLASTETALLIDILVLSSTKEGVIALRQTVGKLLESCEWTLIGFACRQDVSRLRASPCIQMGEEEGQHHWIHTTNAVVDVQPLIGLEEESLRTTGLSRACEHFLGKPLDKSEQCSLWSSRPLTDRQRSYASLDAWVCVGIYQKLLSLKNEN